MVNTKVYKKGFTRTPILASLRRVFSKNTMPNLVSGFTLIELLVVIAIIGILSSVVLASLNTARAKGADAAIQSNLNNTRAQAELWYDNTNGDYTGVCTDAATGIQDGFDAAVLVAGGVGACADGTDYWVAWAGLKEDPTHAWCVDNTGVSKELTLLPVGAITVCP